VNFESLGPDIAAHGEAFSTVWCVERMAHAELARKSATLLGSFVSAMSNSAVCAMFIST
jgi:hypothetical protein